LGKKLSEARRKRYGVVAVVGKEDLDSGTLTVDVSGIPDSRGLVRSDRMLRFAVAQRDLAGHGKQTTKNGSSQEVGQLNQNGMVEIQEARLDGKTQAPSLPPELEVQDLKKIAISPLKLREVLAGLERAFV